jgi:hypothetical protein
MPTAQQLAMLKKALAKAEGIFGITEIELPVVTESDAIHEVASVIAYFDMREKFREETCRGCGNKFAYAYYFTSVKHCSVPCLRKTIRNLGLTWDPNKPFEQRWGSRYVPAIVPAHVYAMINEQAPEPEVPEPVVISDESQDLIKMLDSL